MQFRIADTFTDSLARLTGDEQKAVKTTAFDLQVNPAHPGLSFHKLDKAKDKRFWSVRVSGDLRLIVHRSEGSLLLCYVDRHDRAYQWAERRRLEAHPKTGAAQLVEIHEVRQEVVVPVFVEQEAPASTRPAVDPPSIFAHKSDDELLIYGVPADWLDEVRKATGESLLKLVEHLPAEAAESLLELATGGTPRMAAAPATEVAPFEHPDAKRRFRLMTNAAELEQALEYPWEKWSVFLHPEQRQIVERSESGPARVAGAAGTGKSIVAIHRAAYLARSNPNSRVLLSTFSDTLAHALHTRLARLLIAEPRLGERIDVYSLPAIAARLYRAHVGKLQLATPEMLRATVGEAIAAAGGSRFSEHFIEKEWSHVVDAWRLECWEAYRDVARLGRKTRLPEAQRRDLWSIFERLQARLSNAGVVTESQMFARLAETLQGKAGVFDHCVVDEAQDLSVSQLRFLAAIGGGRPNGLFFAGDLGQRIFQPPFSWKALGVDVRGRSRTLRVNYRTSHQIRVQADRLLGREMVDVDGIQEVRADTISVFNGPPPTIRSFPSEDAEVAAVGQWIRERIADGVVPHEVGVFVRSDGQIERARAAVSAAGQSHRVLDERVETASRSVSIGAMHLGKGLEFRAVAVMACDDEVLPLQERIESVGDDADLQDVYETERHLLYVACTRARDHLLVTSAEPASEFLDDLGK